MAAAVEFNDASAPDRLVWLNTNPKLSRPGAVKVDLATLDPKNLRPTGQSEKHVWHLGDIPAEAVVVTKEQ
jgi:hypothetical protein